MRQHLPLVIALAAVIAITAVYMSAFEPARTAERTEDHPPSIEDATVRSFDGTSIAVTVFRPDGASAQTPVPVILHSHGWSGSRMHEATGIVARLVAEGYGVVSIDARGHGESGGNATVHHETAEVRDSIAVLDWIHDTLDWVAKETGTGVPKDIRAGATGYSYAGALQLTTASHDARLDVLAPEITWNSLADALAPGGVVKSVWVDILYAQAKQSGTRTDPRIDDWYRDAMLTNAFPAAANAHFEGSNVRPDRIRADVLLIQGIPDVLFNLNNAIATFDALEGRQDVRLFTHLSGHVLPTQPLGTSADRRAAFSATGPCGSVEEIIVRWFDEKLRNGPQSGISVVSFALENGECVRLDAMPRTVVEANVDTLPAPSVVGTVVVPLAEGPLLIAGVPTLNATIGALGADTIIHVGLAVRDATGFRILDDQTQPIPLTPGGTLEAVPLVGIAARIAADETLFLRIDGLNEWSIHNGARLPGATLLSDLVIQLPVANA